MNYLQISMGCSPEEQEMLIALLTELGYEGFEQEEKFLQAFVSEAQFDKGALEALLQPFGVGYVSRRIEEKNWNEEWEKNFEPVVVGTFCAVRAFFHAPLPDVQYDLLITPKMSFGTGHHATTWLMLSTMQSLDLRGKSVFDFGTGTGVLAILAEKLGARDVLAIDCDDWSIENARENIAENHCTAIRLEKAEKIPPDGLFDVILANINRNIILRELQEMGQHLADGGVILLSGLLENDFEAIEKKAFQAQLPISERMTKDNWICLRLAKGPKISAAD